MSLKKQIEVFLLYGRDENYTTMFFNSSMSVYSVVLTTLCHLLLLLVDVWAVSWLKIGSSFVFLEIHRWHAFSCCLEAGYFLAS